MNRASALVAPHKYESLIIAILAASCAHLVGCASVPSAPLAGRWVDMRLVTEGPDKELCDAVFAHLISLRPACRIAGTETYPEFREPPWQAVNAHEHRELVKSLLRYAEILERPTFEAGLPSPDDYWTMRTDDFLARGGEVLFWRANMILPPSNGRPQRTIVELVDHLGDEPNDCPGLRSKNVVRRAFVVDDAMQALAADVDFGTALLLANGAVVLYRNDPLIINPNFVGRVTGNICHFDQTLR